MISPLIDTIVIPWAVDKAIKGMAWLAERADDQVTINYHRGPGKDEDLGQANIDTQYQSFTAAKTPLFPSYLLPYSLEMLEIFGRLASSTKDPVKKARLETGAKRIINVLGRCAARIRDENHNYVVLVMSLMLVESKFNPSAQSPFGAKGIMQVKLDTAVDQLIKMDLGTLFALGLKPTDPLFLAVIDLKIKLKDCTSQKTEKAAKAARQVYAVSRQKVNQLITAQQLLFDEQFNVSIGIYYLSTLIEDFKQIKGKKEVDQEVVELAVFAYNGGKGRVESATKKFAEYQAAQMIAVESERKKEIANICNKYGRGPFCRQGWKQYEILDNNDSRFNPYNWSYLKGKKERGNWADIMRPFFQASSWLNDGFQNYTGFNGYQNYWDFLPDETIKYFPKVIEAFDQAKRHPAAFSRKISTK